MGELVLKGDNRPYFERALLRNVRRALEPLGRWDIREEDRRIEVVPVGDENGFQAASVRASRVFGLSGVVQARKVEKRWDVIVAAAIDTLSETLPRGDAPATFKVETRRVDKNFPMRSLEVSRELGGILLEKFPGLKVDVHSPSLVLRVEIRFKGSLVYMDHGEAPGGLPVGTAGRAVALISGGIDSPVALWYALKRGLAVDAIHFHTPGFTQEAATEKVRDLCKLLGDWGGPERLHVINFTPLQQAIWASAPPGMRITLMRRMFVRVAERVALEVGAGALITGESLGQVASQTLESMRAIEDAATLPILRPLVGFDKSEIIERARKIGTYETSILPYEDCCALFVAKHPDTRPSIERIRKVETGFEWGGLIETATSERESVGPSLPPA